MYHTKLVSFRILDSCTELMKVCPMSCNYSHCVYRVVLFQSIRILIERSKELQKEIVSEGRVRVWFLDANGDVFDTLPYQGRSSEKDFYKRNHRWTEGLISAAKAVGWGASVLV